MVAKETYPEALMEEHTTDLHDLYEADDEALSLCDLPIYSSDAADWPDDYSKEYQSSSLDQDFFEFFSEDFSTASTYPAAENIIFCGKLIPYKEPVAADDTRTLQTKPKQNPKKRSLFRWKSMSFNKSKASRSVCADIKQSKSNTLLSALPQNYRYSGGKCIDKYDFSVGRVSILASPAKSRWHLFMFGLARFPTEMELSDIKNRQSRRNPGTLFRSFDNTEEVTVDRSRGKGLWRLLRTLGCASSHANAVVKAPFDCIPNV